MFDKDLKNTCAKFGASIQRVTIFLLSHRTIIVFPDFGAGKIIYVVQNTVVAFCDALFKIVHFFCHISLKHHHIIPYKHTTCNTSSIIFNNFSEKVDSCKSLLPSFMLFKMLFAYIRPPI